MRLWSADDAHQELARANAALEAMEVQCSNSDDDAKVPSHAAAEAQSLPQGWAQLRQAVEQWVRPVLSHCHGLDESAPTAIASTDDDDETRLHARVDSVGCVTSLPGSPDQHFHPDGTASGLINVFCPLVPVLADNGPTELRPGTHIWHDGLYGREPKWDERKQSAVMPLFPVAAGGLLLFDYRCYHRGVANRSLEPRPVAYVAFATREGVSDAHNFPREKSLLKAGRGRNGTGEEGGAERHES